MEKEHLSRLAIIEDSTSVRNGSTNHSVLNRSLLHIITGKVISNTYYKRQRGLSFTDKVTSSVEFE